MFKYYNFFAGAIEILTGNSISMYKSSLLLPVGISFYTFQALGYSIDVYKGPDNGGVRHEKNFINYALFVSFFPQLVAGPIERSANLLPQFREKHNFSVENATEGLRIILVGMFKKIVIADMLALVVDKIFSTYTQLNGLTLLLGIFFFTIQIYCDFSGYSDVARGSALLFGFRLMENFKAPYMSTSIKEFWGKWHISLSTWFKDYVYIPLGGSRVGEGRKYINLMVIFLLSGIWHGANYTFILWGILHGIYRVIEEFVCKHIKIKFRILPGKLVAIFKTAFVFCMVMLFWTYFRADNLAQGNYFITHFFSNLNVKSFQVCVNEFRSIAQVVMANIAGLGEIYRGIIWISILLLGITDWCYKYCGKSVSQMVAKLPGFFRWFCYYGMIILIMFSFIMTTNEYGQAGAFLYFQF
ncbi:MAG: MBOAT family protein [Lachnospiraceae bacterium]|nr:MBOAT family protein [Lachnospiraceae bacterium]